MIQTRHRKAAAWVAAGSIFVGGFEGLRQSAYPDPATKGPPWTICYGETMSVKKGDHASVEECKAQLADRLQDFSDQVDKCIRITLPDTRRIAVVSLAYNIGAGTFCKSTVARKLNEGRTREACDGFLAWNRAAGVVFPGLTRRRTAERELCLEGL